MHTSMTCPRILRRALLTAAVLPLAACYAGEVADGGDEASATQATVAASATDSTGGPDTPTTSAGDTGSSGDDGTTGEPVDCYSTRDFFATSPPASPRRRAPSFAC